MGDARRANVPRRHENPDHAILPPVDWTRLKEVVAGARALLADERPAYVVEACRGNEALRQDVESLLVSDAHAKSVLESPAPLVEGITMPKSLEGQRIGPYLVASRIGAGGMGEVYLASRVPGSHRCVSPGKSAL
jgi:hypothetical protein